MREMVKGIIKKNTHVARVQSLPQGYKGPLE
jgi:hypothetical protein